MAVWFVWNMGLVSAYFPGVRCVHIIKVPGPHIVCVCVCVYLHKVAFSGEECTAPGCRDALLCLCILKCASVISRVFSSLLLRQACSATVTCALENDRLWCCQPHANWRKMKMAFLLMCVQGFSLAQCSSHDLFGEVWKLLFPFIKSWWWEYSYLFCLRINNPWKVFHVYSDDYFATVKEKKNAGSNSDRRPEKEKMTCE